MHFPRQKLCTPLAPSQLEEKMTTISHFRQVFVFLAPSEKISGAASVHNMPYCVRKGARHLDTNLSIVMQIWETLTLILICFNCFITLIFCEHVLYTYVTFIVV